MHAPLVKRKGGSTWFSCAWPTSCIIVGFAVDLPSGRISDTTTRAALAPDRFWRKSHHRSRACTYDCDVDDPLHALQSSLLLDPYCLAKALARLTHRHASSCMASCMTSHKQIIYFLRSIPNFADRFSLLLDVYVTFVIRYKPCSTYIIKVINIILQMIKQVICNKPFGTDRREWNT